ncbi:long-chain fatty acid transport protein 4-like isoform X1 [Cimex lectularius]|uniref:long-chain-fatty-acid--CoA ligase n=2 Tax=Cimex lectularius TaxID=79782 RepID=A0A8I6RXJ3_CIMLE|nr:long-chain fatty acid transport protein 4-like isoform X1 [Cimex lectularius]
MCPKNEQDHAQNGDIESNYPVGGGGGLAGCKGRGRSPSLAFLVRLVAAFLRVAVVVLIVAGAVALTWYFMGFLFVVQLSLVALVAYLAAGGGYKWLYVAAKTAPRDITALLRYLLFLMSVRRLSKRNMCIGEIFRENVAKNPNKVCFIFEDREWTLKEVEDYSNKIANLFKSHGYRKGDTIGLMLESRPEFVCIWLGLSKIGVITALINNNLQQNSLLHSINVANCQAFIFGEEYSDVVKEIQSNLSSVRLYSYSYGEPRLPRGEMGERQLTKLLKEASSAPLNLDDINFHDRLLYIYTSGTTGLPKAAVITHARYVFLAGAISYQVWFKRSDRFYTPLPLYHTAGGAMSVGQAIVYGACVVIRKKFSASSYFTDIVKYNCTVTQYIGEMCRYLLATSPKPTDTQHKIRIIFGNGLRPQIWKEFVKRFNIPRVAEFYGATEGNANIANIDNTVGAIGFVSRIIPSVYPISIIRVDQLTGEPVRNAQGLCIPCQPGEPGVFIGKIIPSNPARAYLGYVNEKESEKKIVKDVFVKGDSAFLSGDIVVSDEFGYLYFKDRTGDTFRWKGENVSTSEVEGVVSNLADFKDCVVYGVEIPGSEGRAGMAAIVDKDHTLNMNKLADGIKKALPAYARPIFIRILGEVEMTGTYKMKKLDLQKEGFDPNVISDKLYYLGSSSYYEPLTSEVYENIEKGKIRM